VGKTQLLAPFRATRRVKARFPPNKNPRRGPSPTSAGVWPDGGLEAHIPRLLQTPSVNFQRKVLLRAFWAEIRVWGWMSAIDPAPLAFQAFDCGLSGITRGARIEIRTINSCIPPHLLLRLEERVEATNVQEASEGPMHGPFDPLASPNACKAVNLTNCLGASALCRLSRRAPVWHTMRVSSFVQLGALAAALLASSVTAVNKREAQEEILAASHSGGGGGGGNGGGGRPTANILGIPNPLPWNLGSGCPAQDPQGRNWVGREFSTNSTNPVAWLRFQLNADVNKDTFFDMHTWRANGTAQVCGDGKTHARMYRHTLKSRPTQPAVPRLCPLSPCPCLAPCPQHSLTHAARPHPPRTRRSSTRASRCSTMTASCWRVTRPRGSARARAAWPPHSSPSAPRSPSAGARGSGGAVCSSFLVVVFVCLFVCPLVDPRGAPPGQAVFVGLGRGEGVVARSSPDAIASAHIPVE
jgi:hypothetical protein